MKTLNLSAYGVEEMKDGDLLNVKGGWILPFIGGALLGGFVYDLICSPSECGDAFERGWNSVN